MSNPNNLKQTNPWNQIKVVESQVNQLLKRGYGAIFKLMVINTEEKLNNSHLTKKYGVSKRVLEISLVQETLTLLENKSQVCKNNKKENIITWTIIQLKA